VRIIFRRKRRERELDDELRFHIEMQTEEHVRRGMDPLQARQAALDAFGGYERIKENCRDARGARVLETLAQDARYALRMLRRNPGFAAVAIVTLGLGIGANTAIFSLVNGVLLRPLPYPDPDRLVQVWSANPNGIPRNGMSPADFHDIREGALARGVAARMGAYVDDEFTLTGAGEPMRLDAATVTTELFDALGVPAALGRTFAPADEDDTAVVILSDSLWRNRFGASPAILGAAVTIDSKPYTVIGVMPRGFGYPSPDTQVWVPLARSWRSAPRGAHFLTAVARLPPAVTPDAARTALAEIARRLEAAYPASNRGWGITLLPLDESLTGGVRRALIVLLAAVGCVLLIACANVASLLLARGTARAREMAVRTAMGATRMRVARQQLTESTILGLLGGAAGLVVAYACVEALRGAGGFDLPRLDDVRFDARVFAGATAAALFTGIATGLAPAWRVLRVNPIEPLRGGRSAAPAAARMRSLLVAAEIALTLALMTGAGLLVRSLAHVARIDAGFDADGVLLGDINLPAASYDAERRAAFFDAVLEQVRALPGVTAAGAGGPIPLSGRPGLLRFGLRIEGRPEPPDGRGDRVYVRRATPHYFRAMGIPLVAGRAFTAFDDRDAPPVVIVDETLAARHFPGESPIGRRIRASNDPAWREIVGVVGGVRQTRFEDAPEPHLYIPQSQGPVSPLTLVVRAAGDPAALANTIRDRVRRLDPGVALFDARPLQDVVRGSVAARRFNALVLGSFAALAALLTLVGIYGITAYWVGESIQEIGVRLALGATRGGILALVLGRSLRLALAGIAAGLVLALAGGQAISGLLFGVGAADPATFAVVTVAVLGVVAAASVVPVRRALAIDPAASLRSD
jgi:predicted permease